MSKIIILAQDGDSTNFIYNKLSKDFKIDHVVIEDNVSRLFFLKRSIKRLGFVKVFGMILFKITIPNMLRITSKKRIKKIKSLFCLDDTAIPKSKISRIESINSEKGIALLKNLSPHFIIVNGTRILSKTILNCTNAIFINTHAGITPKYRGVHGGYWALVNNDLDNCGVTVHFVDSGIDTGEVIFQKNITPTSKDNFCTYPYLQIGEGVNLLQKTIEILLSNKIEKIESQTKESKLWNHPTLWSYLFNRIKKGIK